MDKLREDMEALANARVDAIGVLAAFWLGLLEAWAEGSVGCGMTYDGDPSSPRSRAYDSGLNYGEMLHAGGTVMPRHQFTPEDRRKGGLSHAKKHGRQGHKLTQADRRRGGLATAAKRRAQRAAAYHATIEANAQYAAKLEAIYLGGPEKTLAEVGKMQRAAALSPGPGVEAFYRAMTAGPAPVTLAEAERMRDDFNTTKLGKTIAEKLLSSHTDSCGERGANCDGIGRCDEAMAEKLLAERLPTVNVRVEAPPPPTIDPFTLSALKRFRCGPLSPLALTRSQRAHVEIMLAGGWVEKTPEAMIRLTAKGEAALANEEVSNG